MSGEYIRGLKGHWVEEPGMVPGRFVPDEPVTDEPTTRISYVEEPGVVPAKRVTDELGNPLLDMPPSGDSLL